MSEGRDFSQRVLLVIGALLRLSAFIMFCIGVQSTWNGTSRLVRDFNAAPAVTAPARSG